MNRTHVTLASVVDLNASAPPVFTGTKDYVSTGALDCDHIDPSKIELVSFEDRPSRANLYPAPGDILFAKMAATVKTILVDSETAGKIYSTGFFALHPKDSLISGKLLYHFLFSDSFHRQKDKLSTGATMKGLTNGGFSQITMLLPERAEQDNLADRLDAIRALIFNRGKQLAALDTLAKSLFVEMFGDPATNPSNWKTERLKSCSELLSDGPFGSNLKSSHYVDSGVRVIRLQNIGVGTFLDDDKAFISNSHYDSLKRFTCRPGEVVIGTLGDPNLRACLVPSHIGCAINKSDCVHCIPNHELLLEAFVVAYINSPGTLSLVSGDIHGQTRSRVSSGQLAKMPIFLPPLSLQHAFSERVEAIDKSKFAILRWLSYFDREAATKSARRGLSPAPWLDCD